MKKSTERSQKRIKKLKIDIYQPIVNHTLKQYGITALWDDRGELIDGAYCWWSDIEEKEVLIPKPTNAYKFMVCLHEIGHCVAGRRRLAHMEELVAEEWALRTAKRFGITQVSHYKKLAAKLLLRYIKNDISAGHINSRKINKRVKRFITKTGIKYEM